MKKVKETKEDKLKHARVRACTHTHITEMGVYF